MTSFTLALLLAAAPGTDPVYQPSKPVGLTRDAEKELLEKHKKAKPRLPAPPADATNPLARVNNGAFRAHYLPADLRDSGFAREPDWSTGHKLTSYEIADENGRAGVDVVLSVKLGLVRPDGQAREKKVNFTVGIGSSTVVLRNE